MTDVVTRLVVRGDGSLAVLDQFENKMEAAGKAADRATGAVANYEARMAKARAAMEAGNAISTQTVARRSAEQRAFDGLAASVDKYYGLRIRLEREAERAAVSAANAVNMGYISNEQALTTLVALESRHAAQLGLVAAANNDVAASTVRLTAAMQTGSQAVEMGRMRNQQLMYQMVDMGQAIPLLLQSPIYGLQNMGFQVAQIGQMYFGQGGMGAALKDMSSMLGGAVSRIWPIAAVIGVVSAGIAGLTYEINKTADTQVGFFDVALAGWQLLAEDIAESFAPVFGQLGTWMQQGWDAAAPVFKGIGNAIIATSMSIGMVWKSWPSIMGDAVITAVNVALTGITRLLNESRTQLAQFLSTISTLPIPGVSQLASASLGALRDPIQAPQFSNPYQGAMGTAAGAVSDAFGTDYLGGAFEALSARAQEIARARQETEALGGAAAAANDNVKKLADDGMSKAFDGAKGLASAFQGLGSGIIDAFKKGGDIASNVLDMLMGKLEQFASSWLDNIINNGIDALFSGFGSFGIGSGIGGVSSITGSSGGFFPGFANGTPYAPGGLSWVGERGPELVSLPRGSQVFNHQQSMGLAANSNRPISVQTNIINNAGVEVVERTVEDGQGGVRQEIILNRAIASAVAKPGPAQKAVRSTGQLVRR